MFSHIGQVALSYMWGPWSFCGLSYSVVLVLGLSRIIDEVTILEVVRNGTN